MSEYELLILQKNYYKELRFLYFNVLINFFEIKTKNLFGNIVWDV